MEWFIFLLTAFIWLFSLGLARENQTIFRKSLFTFMTFILGFSLLFSGLSVPNGSSSVVSGSTTTQTIQYLTYTATTSGSNSSPILWGLGWVMTIIGIFGLVFLMVDNISGFRTFYDEYIAKTKFKT